MTPGFFLAVTIALREMRGGLSGFRILVACLALGVAAIAGVGSLSEGITGGIEKDARRLLGGDVAFRLLHRPATDPQRAYLTNSAVVSEVVEMRAMAQVDSRVNPGVESTRRRTLVELKAVDDLYPGGPLGIGLWRGIESQSRARRRELGRCGGAQSTDQTWTEYRRPFACW